MSFFTHLNQCESIGKKAEEVAKEIMNYHGWEAEPASFHQNRIEHYDFIACKQGREVKVEVKGFKRYKGSDETDKPLVLIEDRTVSGGPGWIDGKADKIMQKLHPEKEVWLVYSRTEARQKFPGCSGEVKRFRSAKQPTKQWVGRPGTCKYPPHKPIKDSFRWDSVEEYLDLPSSKIVELQEDQWKIIQRESAKLLF